MIRGLGLSLDARRQVVCERVTRVSAEEADTRWDNSAQATMEACIKSAISFNGLYDFEGRADTRMKDMERGGWRRGKSPA